MTNFEDKSCKALGIILFILIISTWIRLSGCSIPKNELFDDELVPDYFIDSVETSIYVIAN